MISLKFLRSLWPSMENGLWGRERKQVDPWGGSRRPPGEGSSGGSDLGASGDTWLDLECSSERADRTCWSVAAQPAPSHWSPAPWTAHSTSPKGWFRFLPRRWDPWKQPSLLSNYKTFHFLIIKLFNIQKKSENNVTDGYVSTKIKWVFNILPYLFQSPLFLKKKITETYQYSSIPLSSLPLFPRCNWAEACVYLFQTCTVFI